jgi:hypothetical protein
MRAAWKPRSRISWQPPLQVGTLYPTFLRGQAYLLAHDGAAIEFQKLLDHRSIVLNFPTGVLAHLGLARELEQIQFLLGHVLIQTAERYLGCKQRIRSAVNDSKMEAD